MADRGLMDGLVPMQDHSMGPAGNLKQSGGATSTWGPMDFVGPAAVGGSMLGAAALGGRNLAKFYGLVGAGAIGHRELTRDDWRMANMQRENPLQYRHGSVPPDLAGPHEDVPMQDHSLGPAGNLKQSGQANPSWGPMDFVPGAATGVGAAGAGLGIQLANGFRTDPAAARALLAMFTAGGYGVDVMNNRLAKHGYGQGAGGQPAISYNPSVPPDLAGSASEDGSMYGGGLMPQQRRVPQQGF